ncbi:serine/threonine-protein kinase ATM [Prunus yedoensis var. nudiflora]|uniref:Serine/threonine-protein kinase ATM n=1 Tax=Prunus yedoensis var. nudiflora TaxID=2094558 RepID=A0A314ZEU9_PRUYE|nr:serine/threonine-protein kinase ATM [Prunus yedoensis var. nudiflora]
MGAAPTRSTAVEGGSASALEPPKGPDAEENTIVEAINGLGGTQPGPGGSGRESSVGDVGSSRVGEVVKTQVVEPKSSTERSFGDLNVGLSDTEEGGLVESSLLKLRGGEGSVEKLESFSSKEKKAVTDATMAMAGVNGGVEENGSSSDEFEENQDGKHEIIEGKTGVNGERAEENDSFLDEIEEDSDGKPEITEDMGDEGHDFSVGDFVWGKIKSHPWWPAQICDPSDASDYAVKLKYKDRLLVAYFGDGTFAWCHPSQLKPFEENFQEMSKQSSSKAFVNAVQQAVDEIGRLVKLKMSCGCVKKANLLAELKHAAQVTSVSSVLELTVLKSCLSAFYFSKGGYQLPVFCEAQPIPGLEDDEKAVEVPVQGPFEDWLSSPGGAKTGQTDQIFSRSSPKILEDRQYQRRKQKSIADLMEGDDDIQVKTKDGGIMANEGAVSEKPEQKKRKGSESHDESNLVSDVVKRKLRLSKSPTSTLTKKIMSVENDCSGSKEESKKGRLSRRRKKDESFGMDSNDGKMKEEAGDSPLSRDGELRSGGLQSDMKDQIDDRPLSRERKKSKYLSPPFTNLNMLKRMRDIEIESEVSSETQLGERAASNLIGSPHMLNCCTETLKKKQSTELSPKAPAEDEEKSIDPMKTNASASLVLSELRSAALNPSYPIKRKSFEIFRDFMAIFRDSIYRNGSNYELYKNRQPHRKRKNLIFEPGSLGKDQSQTAENLPDGESGHKKIKKSSDKPMGKHAAGTPDLKTRRKKRDEKASPASLFVTFGPGSSLPTKADLIKIYSKFGELNEMETEMFYNNFCARVSFLRISDAEEAFNHSQNDSPFGASNVNFRLHNLSAASKVRELSEISNSPPAKSRGRTKSQPVGTNSQPPVDGEASQLDFIRHKLEKLTSMLDNSDGKVSAVTKSKLESEIKELLETVSTMVESSS